MKKLFILLLMCMTLIPASGKESQERWHHNKYSMFIKIYAKDNRHLLQIILENLTTIDGVQHTETFQLSLDEIFNRQLSVFDTEEGDDDEIEE